MKYILIISVCLTLVSGVWAQMPELKDADEIKVEKITLGREDADGNIVADISVFNPKDIPIYCYIDLNSTKSVKVKLNLIAVKAKGLRPDSKVVVVNYKTKNGENNVEFTVSPEKIWKVGAYRFDVFLGGKLAGSKGFKVEDVKNN